MKNFSLDDSFLAILMVSMLGLFGSVAYEAQHNGMTDPVVAASAAKHSAAAKSKNCIGRASCHLSQCQRVS